VSVQPHSVAKCVHSTTQLRCFFILIDLYIFVRFKDLVKLHREAEDKLKAVDDVDVRVARSALEALITSCERWSARWNNCSSPQPSTSPPPPSP
jgi:hypothetical protein